MGATSWTGFQSITGRNETNTSVFGGWKEAYFLKLQIRFYSCTPVHS